LSWKRLLGKVIVRETSVKRQFDSRPPRLALGWMGDPSLDEQTTSVFHLASYPTRDAKRVPAKVRWMLCSWWVKAAGWLIPYVDKRVGGR